MTAPTVTYWAESVYNSKTLWFNLASFVAAALSLTDVITIVPPSWNQYVVALVAVINLFLRLGTVRPVAFIPPGNTSPVLVARLDPPEDS